MSENLVNSSHQNWNIPQPDDVGLRPNHPEAGGMDPMFPIRTFSSYGGGDAPMMSNGPRLRSRLFTISTRSVLASHSQLNVSYTTSTTSVDADAISDEYVHISPASSPTQIEFGKGDKAGLTEEVKPINTDERLSICPIGTQSSPSDCLKGKECLFDPTKKRCFHTSIENLRENPGLSRRCPQGTDRNRRNSAPIPKTTGTMIDASMELLMQDNRDLHMTIMTIRRKFLFSQVVLGFLMQGVKRRGKAIKRLEIIKLEKEQQCAARMILHSLLLNSWRNTKRELNLKIDDNAELRKSVDNFSLQVQVLRHVQTNQRQKSQEKAAILENLNQELGIIKEENHIMRKEIGKMENKLNSLQASTQNLSEENLVLTREIANVTDNRDTTLQSLDRERARSEQFRRDNDTMKETLKHLESQLNEATEQRSHWQERARCSESEVFSLQLHLETKDSNIKKLSSECHVLREDKINLMEEKSNLKSDLDGTLTALKALGEKTDQFMETYETIKADKDSKEKMVEELKKALELTKNESNELNKELMSYRLHNARRRREWGNALYFIASPMDAFCRRWT